MSTRFLKVVRQAFKTFDRANQSQQNFSNNLLLLKQLTDQLTFQDFHLSQQDVLNDVVFERADRAPTCYIHIFENEIVSMGVFVLRGGYTMPLHDHPMMNGILKGIYGRLKIQSYTQQLDADDKQIYDRNRREISVIAEEPRHASPDTECALLTPYERNFHEITAIGGVAAFFDILSPPYDAEIPIYGSRRCRFYRVDDEQQQHENGSSLRLVRIPVPRWYISDTIEAPETVIKCTFICSAEAYSVT